MKAENIGYIKYTLESEGNSVTRDLKIDDIGNYFIEASNDDLANFFTQYPDTLVRGLYWGKGIKLGYDQGDNSDYSYRCNDRIRVSKGAALGNLEISRLGMLTVYLINIGGYRITLKSISIDGVEVANPNEEISGVGNYNIAKYIENYMSYNIGRIINYSVVIGTTNGDKTVTASVDTRDDNNKVLLDTSMIK